MFPPGVVGGACRPAACAKKHECRSGAVRKSGKVVVLPFEISRHFSEESEEKSSKADLSTVR